MKFKVVIIFVFLFLASQTSLFARTIRLYAGPNVWGPPVTITSCFGERVTTSFSEGSSHVGGVVLYQAKISPHDEWVNISPGGTFIAQVVEIRAKVNMSTGGYMDIEVIGGCAD